MVDSLSLDWAISATDELRNFYVEKGAGTLSVRRALTSKNMAEGYRWTGTSSTYAHPAEGQPREIIPAEIVRSHKHSTTWAGTPASSSAAVRASDSNAVPQREVRPGTESRPRPVPHPPVSGGSFESPTVFLGAFEGGPRRRGQSASFMGARRFGQPDYLEGRALPVRGKQQLGQRQWPWTRPSPCA